MCEPCDRPAKQPKLAAPFFSRGAGTYQVTTPLPAEARAKLLARLRADGLCGVLLLRGGVSSCRNDSDHELLFRQESYFAYLFGVKEPDCWATIELPSGRATLFVPRLPAEYAIWMGEVKSAEAFRDAYRLEAAAYTDQLQARVAEALRACAEEAARPAAVYTLSGTNSDSGADLASVLPTAEGVPPGATVEADKVYEVLADCRTTKSEGELDLLRYVSWITSMAHVEVMRECKPGLMEYQLEAKFLHHIYYYGGCRLAAYTCICACGPNSAVLHYGHAGAPNDQKLEAGSMALLDMGAEYFCYCSDITCSYPVSGTFTPDQAMVYGAVLEAQKQILAAMRPGVSWAAMHRLMWRVVVSALRDYGLLVGELEEMLQAGIGAVFIPCGLGHLIGLDTHDVGGYLSHTPPRIEEAGISKLRTARVLEKGQVLTVEPGCYFIDALLKPAVASAATSKFFNLAMLERFTRFGGVRLEDVVAVTESGVENYTLCPRTIGEVESVMAGGAWPPAKDEAPWLFRQWGTLDATTGAVVTDQKLMATGKDTKTV